MRVDPTPEAWLETLSKCDSATIAVKAEKDGKISINMGTFTDTKKILAGEVLEVRVVNGSLRVSRKRRFHDVNDPYVAPYDPYGDGTISEFLDETPTAETSLQPGGETSLHDATTKGGE